MCKRRKRLLQTIERCSGEPATALRALVLALLHAYAMCHPLRLCEPNACPARRALQLIAPLSFGSTCVCHSFVRVLGSKLHRKPSLKPLTHAVLSCHAPRTLAACSCLPHVSRDRAAPLALPAPLLCRAAYAAPHVPFDARRGRLAWTLARMLLRRRRHAHPIARSHSPQSSVLVP